MKVWPFWKYVYFNRIQRWGLISILFLLLAVIIAEAALTHLEANSSKNTIDENTRKDYALLHQQLDSLQRQQADYFKKNSPQKPQNTQFTPQKSPPKTTISIDINLANSEQWKSVPGIGNVLSERIVKYREKLGGFASIAQLKEVYGITDSTFRVIKPYLKHKNKNIKTLNINTSSLEVLAAHPYFRSRWAKQMVNYRTKVKPFEKVEDIKNLYGMTDSIYLQIAPYLTTEN